MLPALYIVRWGAGVSLSVPDLEKPYFPLGETPAACTVNKTTKIRELHTGRNSMKWRKTWREGRKVAKLPAIAVQNSPGNIAEPMFTCSRLLFTDTFRGEAYLMLNGAPRKTIVLESA